MLLLKVALSSLGVGIVALTLLPTVWSEWWVGALLTNFRVHLVLLGALTILRRRARKKISEPDDESDGRGFGNP